jgi:hypothetical protein
LQDREDSLPSVFDALLGQVSLNPLVPFCKQSPCFDSSAPLVR